MLRILKQKFCSFITSFKKYWSALALPSHLSCRITQETFVEGHRCGTRAFPIFAAATSRQSLQCSYNVFIGSRNIRWFDITCKRVGNSNFSKILKFSFFGKNSNSFFFQKITMPKSHSSQNSHFQNLIFFFYKIHIFKT